MTLAMLVGAMVRLRTGEGEGEGRREVGEGDGRRRAELRGGVEESPGVLASSLVGVVGVGGSSMPLPGRIFPLSSSSADQDCIAAPARPGLK